MNTTTENVALDPVTLAAVAESMAAMEPAPIVEAKPLEYWRIEMREEGRWVKLGGIYSDANTADARIDAFMLHFLHSPSGNGITECKREFRRQRVTKDGNWI